MKKKRVFISFDFDHDKILKDFIIGQAKNPDSPFEVIDHSLKEKQPEREWEAKAYEAIRRADVFIVMLGSKTRYARGVQSEVKMAQHLEKPRFQIIGYENGNGSWAVEGAGQAYNWNWETLKRLLS